VARHGAFRVFGLPARGRAGSSPPAQRLAAHGRTRLACVLERAPPLGAGGWRATATGLALRTQRARKRPAGSAPLVERLRPGGDESRGAGIANRRTRSQTETVAHGSFRAFRGVLDRLRRAPSAPRRPSATPGLTALTRVLFLYYVQAKGWLDGDAPTSHRLTRHSPRGGTSIVTPASAVLRRLNKPRG